MTEEKIRSQTQVIMDAYASVIGTNLTPSISDFLKIRAAAIDELKNAEGEGRFVQPSAQVEALSLKPNGQQMVVMQQERSAERESLQPVQAQSQKPETSQMQESVDGTGFATLDMGFGKTEAPKQKSPFEILRGIKDPWND